jgi:hypothetical protein
MSTQFYINLLKSQLVQNNQDIQIHSNKYNLLKSLVYDPTLIKIP